jgi:hypothetical protein
MTQIPSDPSAERALIRAQDAADRDFLGGILFGEVHLLDPDLGERLIEVLTRHGAGGPVHDLAVQAIDAYSDAAIQVAAKVLREGDESLVKAAVLTATAPS